MGAKVRPPGLTALCAGSAKVMEVAFEGVSGRMHVY